MGLRAEGALVDRVGHCIVEGLKRMQNEETERHIRGPDKPAPLGGSRPAEGSHIVQAFSKGLCCKSSSHYTSSSSGGLQSLAP